MLHKLHPRRLDPDARTFGIGYLLLLPLYLAPLFVARFLPGLDLPFHLSMVDMLTKQGEASSPYQPYYEGGFAVAPYAAHYLALRVFGLVLPLMAAHKVVVGLYVAAFPLAAALLLGACGRSRVPALLAFPLAYNLSLHYGFVSFALSLPVVFLLLACLAQFLKEPETKFWLGGATALAAILLFLCHLQNFLYGVCAGLSFLAFAGCAWRRRLLGLATLLPVDDPSPGLALDARLRRARHRRPQVLELRLAAVLGPPPTRDGRASLDRRDRRPPGGPSRAPAARLHRLGRRARGQDPAAGAGRVRAARPGRLARTRGQRFHAPAAGGRFHRLRRGAVRLPGAAAPPARVRADDLLSALLGAGGGHRAARSCRPPCGASAASRARSCCCRRCW